MDFYRQHKFDKSEVLSHAQGSNSDSLDKECEIFQESDEVKKFVNNELTRDFMKSNKSAFSLFNNKKTNEIATQTDALAQTATYDLEFNGQLVDFCKKSIDLIEHVHNILTINKDSSEVNQTLNHNNMIFNFKENVLPVKMQLGNIYDEIEKKRKIFSFLGYYYKDLRAVN